MFHSNALGLIGNTPLIALDRMHRGPGRIIAKAEFLQPGGSVKDRAAKAILLAAKADGRLSPGMRLRHDAAVHGRWSGSRVCRAGHPLIVTMSAGSSPARVRMLEGLGATVILVPQVNGCAGQVTGLDIQAAADLARQLASEQRGFYVDQFNAPEGELAHRATGQEMLEQFGSRIDGWVAAVGTGSTFKGVARVLKMANPETVCAVAEPLRATAPWQASRSTSPDM